MVGLFWFVEDGGYARILALATPLDQAVAYGNVLTLETGHFEYWTSLSNRGAGALRAEGLPTAPIWSDYDEWPRGRVLYDQRAGQFVIRADSKLHRPAFLRLIAAQFRIRIKDAAVFSDDHYQSPRSFTRPHAATEL